MFGVEGKRALVTGGSRGLGHAIALALKDAGADVALTSRKGEDGALPLDVRDHGSIAACFDRVDRMWGGLDILVNNAGTNIPQDVMTLDEASWDAVVDTDLKGLAFVSQAAAARMIAGETGGRIVNIASIWGLVSRRERVAYSAAKTGVVGITRALALDLAKHGITVNAVAPSLVETDLTRERLARDPSYREEELARTPLARLCTPLDVAAAVLFFASPAAAFVTGQTLAVDGGTSAH